jgi:hypothetical protein
MITGLISTLLAVLVLFFNVNLKSFTSGKYETALICVSEYTKYYTAGFENQVADFFWIRFLQELDAYNQLTIAEPHLCPDKTSSWHFHIMNVAFDLDKKFFELYAHAPLLVSITIGDVVGGSVLFDKSVEAYPNDWRILYRAAYQAMIEEKNKKKGAELLYRAGKQGAPPWVMSLSGGLYNETGDRQMAERIYSELLANAKDADAAARLKLKLDNKLKNFNIQKYTSDQKVRK